MKTATEKAKVMLAFDRGEKIETRNINECYRRGFDIWDKCEHPGWNWVVNDYRIAQQEKKKVVLYQYLCEDEVNGLWITEYLEKGPTIGVVRRLDETRMEVEV